MKIGTKVAVVGLPTYVAGILYAEQMALVNGTVCTVISAERQEFFSTKFAPAHDVEDASGNQWCINSIHLIPLDETMAHSEGYTRKENAEKAVQSIKRRAAAALWSFNGCCTPGRFAVT